MPPSDREVLNQPPPLVDYNLFSSDPALQEGVVREGAAWAREQLTHCGALLGRRDSFELGRLANRYPPLLHSFDAQGFRLDEVEFHPAWHTLMRGIVSRGLHCAPWEEPRPGAHVARAAAFLLQAQVEAGTLCPTTMTFGAIPVLSQHAGLTLDWLPTLCSRDYDERELPIGQKRGGLIGMGMTERQGGSDVRANTTYAEPSADGSYRLSGHKWFFSVPQSDAHLVLAQAPGGLSCFFLPRWLPDGTRNAVRLLRLKDKLGNRSNASAEVEFEAAYGVLLGEEGRGVPIILEMGGHTRLDCLLGSAGLMRQVLAQAIHHCCHRRAFGRSLIEQPLMLNVLADMALETEAAIALALRLARASDSPDDEGETLLRRLLVPAGKYWVCKRGPELAAEAMEVLGGNGYMAESVTARAYAEMPVNSIWEGSGNVMCLDVLRTLAKHPRALEVLLAELAQAPGRHPLYRHALGRLTDTLSRPVMEADARHLVRCMVLLVQAGLLLRHAPEALAEAFCASRLGEDWGGGFGSLPSMLALAPIVRRALAD
ncbi:MAG TPA: isovaleryl-CoA dehydrogenase [Pseudogulbenkiania sp.]|nr:isovaleryl-CoA dehydrogenase [Pseudogulbenkiania sp.]